MISSMRNCVYCHSYVDKAENYCPNCGKLADGTKTMILRAMTGFISIGIGFAVGFLYSWWLAPIVFLLGLFLGIKIFRRGL